MANSLLATTIIIATKSRLCESKHWFTISPNKMNIVNFIKKIQKNQRGNGLNYKWIPLQTVLVCFGMEWDISGLLISEYITFCSTLVQTYGNTTSVKVLKDLNNVINRVTLGVKATGNSTVTLGGIWFKSFKETGIPLQLKIMNRVVKEHPRAANTVSAIVRVFRGDINYDISTITNPFSGNNMDWIFQMVNNYLPKLKPTTINLTISNIFHSTFNAGPFGAPAILNCSKDRRAMNYNQSLLDRVLCLLFISGFVTLIRCIINFDPSNEEVQNHSYNSYCAASPASSRRHDLLARLEYLQDKAGKTRLVYILNWFLQEALYPIHQTLMDWLRHRPNDATFDQGSAAENIRILTGSDTKCYCHDLTAATDRWPVSLQYFVLVRLMGTYWAELWKTIISVNPYSDHKRKFINYAVGQPMGALSSWAAFAVTHHVLLLSICTMLQVGTDCFYILGDDIVITNDKVAKVYEQALLDMGVTISLAKSVTPELLIEGCNSAEFAKQLFRNGENLSPVSIALLLEIFVDHQYWKIIDLARNALGYSTTLVYVHDKFMILHPFISSLLSLINVDKQRDMLVLLSSTISSAPQETFNKLLSSGKSDCQDWREYHNPWYKDVDQQVIDPLSIHIIIGQRAQEELRIRADKLLSLLKQFGMEWSIGKNMEGSTHGELVGVMGQNNVDLTSHPFHPVYGTILRLYNAINKVLGTINTGSSDSTSHIIDLMIEVDFITEVVVKGVPYSNYVDKKSRRSKYTLMFSLKVHKDVFYPEVKEKWVPEEDWGF